MMIVYFRAINAQCRRVSLRELLAIHSFVKCVVNRFKCHKISSSSLNLLKQQTVLHRT